jgi:hypothetical protein
MFRTGGLVRWQMHPLGKDTGAELPALQLRMTVENVIVTVDIRRACFDISAVWCKACNNRETAESV